MLTDQLHENMIDTIEGSCAVLKMRGQAMIDQLNTIVDKLSRCLPEHFVYKHGCVEFRQEYLATPAGSYGAAFCYYRDDDVKGRPVPTEWEEAGKHYYFLNDRDLEIWTANRVQIANVAKALPDFLGNLQDYLRRTNVEMEDATAILKKMVKEGE